jgi:hypothetical protein
MPEASVPTRLSLRVPAETFWKATPVTVLPR